MQNTVLKAPFPWFGGKSKVATQVWERFGDVPNYVEPFFGSGAVLLGRLGVAHTETINDLDGFVANFWRSVQYDPCAVAEYADWPVNENDLHARHGWLNANRQTLSKKLEGDPNYYDPQCAGWWVWGISQWIGTGWCSGEGPWIQLDGELVDSRQLPHLSGSQGINRKLPHLAGGKGIGERGDYLNGVMGMLATRLREVRVVCGDWKRICGPSVTYYNGLTGVFLDPPYSSDEHAADYAVGAVDVATDVRQWAITEGDNPLMRSIALCGYDGEHELPSSWTCVEWKASGGYGNQGEGRGRDNAARERIWFSPHCVPVVPAQTSMFGEACE